VLDQHAPEVAQGRLLTPALDSFDSMHFYNLGEFLVELLALGFTGSYE
jgi:hypothetical protein